MRSKGRFPLYVSICVKRTLLKLILMREPRCDTARSLQGLRAERSREIPSKPAQHFLHPCEQFCAKYYGDTFVSARGFKIYARKSYRLRT